VAAEAPKVMEEVRPSANETGLMSRLRTIINTFVRSYRFTFVGRQPTVGTDQAALYADYAYTAVPVGDGPSTRRGFAVFPDGSSDSARTARRRTSPIGCWEPKSNLGLMYAGRCLSELL
jgi:hypothetical protein